MEFVSFSYPYALTGLSFVYRPETASTVSEIVFSVFFSLVGGECRWVVCLCACRHVTWQVMLAVVRGVGVGVAGGGAEVLLLILLLVSGVLVTLLVDGDCRRGFRHNDGTAICSTNWWWFLS